MTADTYSNTIGVLLMGTGNDNNTWGSNANASVFQIFEDAIANALTSAVTGGTLDLSGTPPPAGPSQVRHQALIFTGVLASNQTFVVPNLNKVWWVKNNTSGAFTLKFKTPSGSVSTAIPQNGAYQNVFCDGANNITVSPFNFTQIQMPDGSAAVPPFSALNELNSGWYRHGTQDWRFSVNGTDIFQVTGASGSPASALNVLQALQVGGAAVSTLPSGVEFPYAGVALPTGYLWEFGQAVSRASFPGLLAALRQGFNGTFSSGSSTISSVSVDLRNTGLEGATLECSTTGINGLTIVSVTSSTITMSGNASGNSGGSVAILAYPYGNGDGSTSFNVPDRRGRVLAGRDNMTTTPGSAAAGRLTTGGSGVNGIELIGTGGVETVTVGQGNLPNVAFTISGITLNDPHHSHTLTGGHPAGAAIFQPAVVGNPGPGASSSAPPGAITATDSAATGITISSQGTAASGGSGTALTNTQPTGVTNYIIKT